MSLPEFEGAGTKLRTFSSAVIGVSFNKRRFPSPDRLPNINRDVAFFESMSLPLLTNFRRVSCLSAHNDDIEIACFGMFSKMIAQVPEVEVHRDAFTAPCERAEDALHSAEAKFGKKVTRQITLGSFRESYFSSGWSVIRNWLRVASSQQGSISRAQTRAALTDNLKKCLLIRKFYNALSEHSD